MSSANSSSIATADDFSSLSSLPSISARAEISKTPPLQHQRSVIKRFSEIKQQLPTIVPDIDKFLVCAAPTEEEEKQFLEHLGSLFALFLAKGEHKHIAEMASNLEAWYDGDEKRFEEKSSGEYKKFLGNEAVADSLKRFLQKHITLDKISFAKMKRICELVCEYRNKIEQAGLSGQTDQPSQFIFAVLWQMEAVAPANVAVMGLNSDLTQLIDQIIKEQKIPLGEERTNFYRKMRTFLDTQAAFFEQRNWADQQKSYEFILKLTQDFLTGLNTYQLDLELQIDYFLQLLKVFELSPVTSEVYAQVKKACPGIANAVKRKQVQDFFAAVSNTRVNLQDPIGGEALYQLQLALLNAIEEPTRENSAALVTTLQSTKAQNISGFSDFSSNIMPTLLHLADIHSNALESVMNIMREYLPSQFLSRDPSLGTFVYPKDYQFYVDVLLQRIHGAVLELLKRIDVGQSLSLADIRNSIKSSMQGLSVYEHRLSDGLFDHVSHVVQNILQTYSQTVFLNDKRVVSRTDAATEEKSEVMVSRVRSPWEIQQTQRLQVLSASSSSVQAMEVKITPLSPLLQSVIKRLKELQPSGKVSAKESLRIEECVRKLQGDPLNQNLTAKPIDRITALKLPVDLQVFKVLHFAQKVAAELKDYLLGKHWWSKGFIDADQWSDFVGKATEYKATNGHAYGRDNIVSTLGARLGWIKESHADTNASDKDKLADAFQIYAAAIQACKEPTQDNFEHFWATLRQKRAGIDRFNKDRGMLGESTFARYVTDWFSDASKIKTGQSNAEEQDQAETKLTG